MAPLGSRPALLAPRPARASERPGAHGCAGPRDGRPRDTPEKERAMGRRESPLQKPFDPRPAVSIPLLQPTPRRGSTAADGPSPPPARGGRCPRAVAGPGAPGPALRPPPAYKGGGPGPAGGAVGTVSVGWCPVGAFRSLFFFFFFFSLLSSITASSAWDVSTNVAHPHRRPGFLGVTLSHAGAVCTQ